VDFEAITRLSPYLLKGVWVTILLNALSIPLAATLGLMIAVMRLSHLRFVSFFGGLYSDFFRSTPIFVQIVWIFYALPILTGVQFPKFAAGVIALSAYIAAFYAEVYRAGILAVPAGQREAALAQGMTGTQTLRRVVLPQALMKMLPAFIGTVVIQIKESAIVSVIGVGDLMFDASTVAAVSRRPLEVLTGAAILYIALAYPPTVIGNYMHRRNLRGTA
jgi:polar amino acid transport system permease protein